MSLKTAHSLLEWYYLCTTVKATAAHFSPALLEDEDILDYDRYFKFLRSYCALIGGCNNLLSRKNGAWTLWMM